MNLFFAQDRWIYAAYHRAKRLEINDESKLVLFSDCHRGTGAGADNFAKNQKLYYVALGHYYRNGFTYIELGDGDELWEERHMADITAEYDHIFGLLADFYRAGRLHMIYGNHDMVKGRADWAQKNLRAYCPGNQTVPVPLFPHITVSEAILLHHTPSGRELLLLHGHQADFFNYRLWWLGRFLVRYLWQPLELLGMQNPFDTPRRAKRRNRTEKILEQWGEKTNIPIVAGHTHRPILPQGGEGAYYNTGSAVHTRYITAIEIEQGALALVKWEVAAKEDGTLYITKEPVTGPRNMEQCRERVKHISSFGKGGNAVQCTTIVVSRISTQSAYAHLWP